jgi:hypothetical protein
MAALGSEEQPAVALAAAKGAAAHLQLTMAGAEQPACGLRRSLWRRAEALSSLWSSNWAGGGGFARSRLRGTHGR